MPANVMPTGLSRLPFASNQGRHMQQIALLMTLLDAKLKASSLPARNRLRISRSPMKNSLC
jgi:hypothetical protein